MPVEDITVVILDTPQAVLTSALLSALQDAGVSVITCDATHHPNGVLQPFLPHSRQAQVAHVQIACPPGLKKRLWQRLVVAKITGQAVCLDHFSSGAGQRLHALAQHVTPGDISNHEAQAARSYWPLLFGKSFRRHGTDGINAALNYGYAVARACVARSLVAYGLIPAFGLHHKNDLNAFNLADDLIEAVRPLVDLHVREMVGQGQILATAAPLNTAQRQHLVAVTTRLMWLSDERTNLIKVCDTMAASLVSAMRDRKPEALLLPSLITGDAAR